MDKDVLIGKIKEFIVSKVIEIKSIDENSVDFPIADEELNDAIMLLSHDLSIPCMTLIRKVTTSNRLYSWISQHFEEEGMTIEVKGDTYLKGGT